MQIELDEKRLKILRSVKEARDEVFTATTLSQAELAVLRLRNTERCALDSVLALIEEPQDHGA